MIVLLLALASIHTGVQAQELNAKVTVIANQIQGVDAKIFKTLEQSIQTFINNRKWTNDSYDVKEKIQCAFTLVITKKLDGDDNYDGSLTIQSSRPIYNTSYQSTLLNYVDKDVAFKYAAFQQLEFNENRIAGSDALTANLPAVIAYYVNLILAFDYDSFALNGGTNYYNKCLNIINNAPEAKAIKGWKSSESQKNRYWIIDQILNNRFANYRQSIYIYHRLGLDVMTENVKEARSSIASTFGLLQKVNQENPGTAAMLLFFSSKNEELLKFLSASTMQEKVEYVSILSQLDITNAAKYAATLKE